MRNLSKNTDLMLDCQDHKRLRAIRKITYVNNARDRKFQKTLEHFLSAPDIIGNKIKNMLVVGDSLGKTTQLRQFKNRHITQFTNRFNIINRVAWVDPPAECNEEELYKTLFISTFNSWFPSAGKTELHSKLKLALANEGMKIIIIDQLDISIAVSNYAITGFLNAISKISEDFCLRFIISGTEPFLKGMFENSMSDSSSFFIERLQKIEISDFLFEMEKILPLKKASALNRPEFCHKIKEVTSGNIPEMLSFVKKCAVIAITSGEERITLDIVNLVNTQRKIKQLNLAS